MIHLNAGNLWDHKYLDKVIELNSLYTSIKVDSLFGSIAKLTPTARAADRLPYRDWSFTDHYIAKCSKHSIACRYTLNQSCIGPLQDFKHNWDAKLKDDIQELHDVGVHEWTVTSPLICMLLREMFPTDFIEVSTIYELSTPEDATRWLELGADGVNISTAINRDFKQIKRIADTGIKVSILANEACLHRCLYRRECYNLSSHDSSRSEELFSFYPFRHCNERRMRLPEEWIMSRLVLPQWMSIYQQQTDVSWFKVAYRTHPYEIAIPILELYMRRMHAGNLLDLWPTISHLGNTEEPASKQYISCAKLDELGFIEHFVEGGHLCQTLSCNECKWCARVTQEAAKKG